MAEKSKYDTNPLDPDYARRADDVWGARGSAQPTEDISGSTREVARTQNEQARADENAEAPTRRYDNNTLSASYPSVFVPPTTHTPASYGAQAGHMPFLIPAGAPTARTVPGVNLPENVTTILPYIPYLGWVLALVELFLVPRREGRTRFHAAQGLSLHIAVFGVGFLFKFVSALVSSTMGGVPSIMVTIASTLFSLAALVFFIVSIIRVWKGEAHVIAPLGETVRWLNEKIDPRNK